MTIIVSLVLTYLIAGVVLYIPVYFLGKRYKKEWAKLEDLQSRQYSISSKDELNSFTIEVTTVAENTLNTVVKTELLFILYYLKGLKEKYEDT